MRVELTILAMLMVMVAFIFLLFIIPMPKRDIPYICSTVEFNPDMTLEARKKCRDLRSTKN